MRHVQEQTPPSRPVHAGLASVRARTYSARMMTSSAQLRAAAHLVAAELQNAREAATFILHGEPFTHLPVDAWQQCRLLLAEAIEFDEWKDLATAYRCIHAYNWRVSAGVLESSGQKERILGEIIDSAGAAEPWLTRLDEGVRSDA
jgi:hypothetical protein